MEANIKWVVPLEGWVKINTNGASRGEKQMAGCGGLIGGCVGKWVCGFAKKLGMCSALKAELWAVLTGLELALCKYFDSVIVECDSSAVVYMLNNLQISDDAETRLLAEINTAMKKFSRIMFVHMYREGNRCADALANVSFDQEEMFVMFDSPPIGIDCLLYREHVGVSYPRFIFDSETNMG